MAKRNTPADPSPKSSTATIGFEAKLWLTAELEAQFAESPELAQTIRANLNGLFPKSEK
jgi:hypothetical protein